MTKIKIQTEQWEDIYGGSIDSLVELIEKHKSDGAISYRTHGDRDGDVSLVFNYEREETDEEYRLRGLANERHEQENKKRQEWLKTPEGVRWAENYKTGLQDLFDRNNWPPRFGVLGAISKINEDIDKSMKIAFNKRKDK